MISINKFFDKNPLFFAFLFPSIVDMMLTLVGQNKYYAGNIAHIREASPAYYFLQFSWLFILGSIIWWGIWYLLFLKISHVKKLFFTILFIAGHSWGSSSWIMLIAKHLELYNLNNQGQIMFVWSLIIVYLSLVASLASIFISKYFKSQTYA